MTAATLPTQAFQGISASVGSYHALQRLHQNPQTEFVNAAASLVVTNPEAILFPAYKQAIGAAVLCLEEAVRLCELYKQYQCCSKSYQKIWEQKRTQIAPLDLQSLEMSSLLRKRLIIICDKVLDILNFVKESLWLSGHLIWVSSPFTRGVMAQTFSTHFDQKLSEANFFSNLGTVLELIEAEREALLDSCKKIHQYLPCLHLDTLSKQALSQEVIEKLKAFQEIPNKTFNHFFTSPQSQ